MVHLLDVEELDFEVKPLMLLVFVDLADHFVLASPFVLLFCRGALDCPGTVVAAYFRHLPPFVSMPKRYVALRIAQLLIRF